MTLGQTLANARSASRIRDCAAMIQRLHRLVSGTAIVTQFEDTIVLTYSKEEREEALALLRGLGHVK